MTGSQSVLTNGALARLRAAEGSLPPALKRLATAVLENPRETLYQSVTELAEAAQAGEASVIRLCRDLGFKGFQDFKLALAADLANDPNTTAGDDAAPTELGAMLDRALHEATAALVDTRAINPPDALERVVTALAGAREILVYGAGASGVTARDFAYKFTRLGLRAVAVEDAHLAAMNAANLEPRSVVIGISRSGSTIDAVRVLEIARERGVTTVALTQRPKSPATAAADHVLLTAAPESPLTGGSIPAKIGQLLLLDFLYVALLRRRPGAADAVATTARAVTDRNY